MLRKLSNGLKWLVWPFSAVYQLITWFRNYLYDHHLFKNYVSPIFTINVGNLTVGGTGKTPHIEYLLRLLAGKMELATLSRGYGRQTKGFRAATPLSTAAEIGDEPLQFYQKFGQDVPVVVCEKRAIGLQRIEQKYPKTQLVLLDDAFQHRAVRPHLNILLTDYHRPFYEDFSLPLGRLREGRAGAKRADVVVVSKCPNTLFEREREQIYQEIKPYVQADTPIFFSTIHYATPQPYFSTQPAWTPTLPCLTLSGIAQPLVFQAAAEAQFEVIENLVYADHHCYTTRDLTTILRKAKNRPLLTTEKDWVKLRPLLAKTKQENAPCFYFWPIEIAFVPSQSGSFDKWLLGKIDRRSKVRGQRRKGQ